MSLPRPSSSKQLEPITTEVIEIASPSLVTDTSSGAGPLDIKPLGLMVHPDRLVLDISLKAVLEKSVDQIVKPAGHSHKPKRP